MSDEKTITCNVVRLNNRMGLDELHDMLKEVQPDNIIMVAVKDEEVHSYFQNANSPFTMLGALESVKRSFLDEID